MSIDNEPNYQPSITRGPRGYMAHGIGWAVGPYPTEQEAIDAFRKAQDRNREIDNRAKYWNSRPRRQS